MEQRPTYLFFDTETTGTPKNYKAPVSDSANWPRMIQLAWALYNCEGKLFMSYSELIKPDGWVIPTEKFWIDNGYSQEQSLAKGVPLLSALAHFISAMGDCTHLVAHNMAFDEKIVGAEMFREQMKYNGPKPIKICTMNNDPIVNFCKLPGKGKSFKWPKLIELHQCLFGKEFEGAHNAMYDVQATAKCFFELGKREIIQVPIEYNN